MKEFFSTNETPVIKAFHLCYERISFGFRVLLRERRVVYYIAN